MARGRMINKEISTDKKIHDLSDDTSRLAFTWLIAFADCEGRVFGDPALIKSYLFPRREDITVEQIQGYIQEWHDCGLIVWYVADGDQWICFPNFEKNQVGLRKDREPESRIPKPPFGSLPDDCRNNDGSLPDNSPVKRKEEKGKENNNGVVFKAFEGNISALTPYSSELIGEWIDTYSDDWIIEAIHIAVKQNIRKPAYIEAILKNWQQDGKDSFKGKQNEIPEGWSHA